MNVNIPPSLCSLLPSLVLLLTDPCEASYLLMKELKTPMPNVIVRFGEQHVDFAPSFTNQDFLLLCRLIVFQPALTLITSHTYNLFPQKCYLSRFLPTKPFSNLHIFPFSLLFFLTVIIFHLLLFYMSLHVPHLW